MYVLGIDTGTQSTKTVVFDLEKAAVVAQASEAYEMIEGLPEGHREQDPALWIKAVDSTVRSCLKQLGDDVSRVAAIGVSGQQHGLVVLDSENRIIRPAKLWCDTSTTEQCDEIARAFGGSPGLIELAGNPILPGYTASKILWLKQNEPQNFQRIETILLPHDFINYWLTGVKRMEPGDASGTGLFDVRNRCWSHELIDFIDPMLHQALPQIGSSRDVLGPIRPELATAWGLGSHVLVSAGGGDNMMGAIGTGNVTEGQVTVSLGTSGTVFGVSDQPLIDPQGEVAAFCDSTDKWLPLVCTMNATVVTEAVRKHYGWDHERMEKEVASATMGAEGLMMLPYLQGERTPGLPDGCGVIHGLNMTNFTSANMMRAAMEGVSLSLGYGMLRLNELGLEATSVRLTGGGSRSPVWRQMLADVFGLPVVGLQTDEGAALGAALQAAVGFFHHSGESLSYEEIISYAVKPDEETLCEPDESRHEFYQNLLSRQQYLVETLHIPGFL
ncbi:xylulokinase [Oceaniferula spumae]|uniref:Xylulose kinase n=1 Tax=Oceaniferula spumae TaxID=2979115 RepID=A0AAT9FRG9_9BACT